MIKPFFFIRTNRHYSLFTKAHPNECGNSGNIYCSFLEQEKVINSMAAFLNITKLHLLSHGGERKNQVLCIFSQRGGKRNLIGNKQENTPIIPTEKCNKM